jgi:hypothetical protein
VGRARKKKVNKKNTGRREDRVSIKKKLRKESVVSRIQQAEAGVLAAGMQAVNTPQRTFGCGGTTSEGPNPWLRPAKSGAVEGHKGIRVDVTLTRGWEAALGRSRQGERAFKCLDIDGSFKVNEQETRLTRTSLAMYVMIRHRARAGPGLWGTRHGGGAGYLCSQ